ncbi:MAG: hypothetical protein H7A05_11455 [Pseudomonadales bacterium]|nr:hypothetical protein [Pseudomonadales bacterium]
MSSGNAVDAFRQQEAEQLVSARKYNWWSRVLVQLLITEYESKLMASDLPVEEERSAFWEM